MKPVIYQMLPRLFGNLNDACVPNGTIEQNGSGKLSQITPEVLAAIKELGATHVWYTGMLEHATKTDYSARGIAPDAPGVVKGQAGSPYAIKDYYDIDPDLADDVAQRRHEWDQLVERTHRAGMRVVMDFVPNHTARHYHSDAAPSGVGNFGDGDDTSLYFGRDNNYYYIPRQLFSPQGVDIKDYREFPAKVTGNDAFTAFPGVNDWYETVKLNYGLDYGDRSTHYDPVPNTWLRMRHILLHWARRGADAFRCDMAHMVPLEFWRWVIPQVKHAVPGTQFIAEIYDVGLYRPFIEAGFDYLYDKVNLYDTLRAIICGNLSAANITSCWQTVEGISDNMLNFLENHDEQRFGSRFFAGNPMRALPALAISALLGRGAMMIYMGQELGERGEDAEGFSGADGRTTIFDYWSVPALRQWLAPDGKPSDKRLSAQQQWLRSTYGRLLNICNAEPAISEGSFFDLMYVNYDNPRFNPHSQYAFLRHYGDTLLLVVVNFSDSPVDIAVNIPAHAFDTLGIASPGRAVRAIELITGRHGSLTLSPDAPAELHLEANGASVWKMRVSLSKPSRKTT